MLQSGENNSGVIINFHPEFFCIYEHNKEVTCDGTLFNNVYDTPIVNINKDYAKKLNWLIDEIKEDLNKKKLAYNESIISHLKLILINCSRMKKEQNPNSLKENK